MELVVEGRAFVKGRLSNWAIGIDNGKIVAVSKRLKGEQRLDYKDWMILPAAIDPHVHFRDPGMTQKEDFSTGTLAAACGGVGCVFDMPNTLPASTGLRDLMEKKEAIQRKAWVDYGLFAGCMPGGKYEDMAPHVIGFKMFMGSSTGKLLITDDKDMARIAKAAKASNKVLSVHAEDENLIGKAIEHNLDDHLRNRPYQAEVEAINRLARLDCRINICHLSSAAGLEAASKLPFTKEVAAHHMFLDRTNDKGAFAKVNPPLRTKDDRLALLTGFTTGKIDMLGSDHAPHTIEDKMQEFSSAPSGMPGVETQIPMLLALVKKGMLPLDVLVKAMAERPAEVFGLNKGKIEEGKDADLMIVDPRAMTAIKVNNLHSKCGWTLYEGYDALFPHTTMVRGQIVVEEGSIAGERAGRDVTVSDIDVDMSELEGRLFTCDDKCGLCCLCQAEVLPHEVPFFKQNHPTKIVMKNEPHRHVALALKGGEGPCSFLTSSRRCQIYKDRPHYCRQFPFHIYLGTRVQVELDLSCRGVWTGGKEDALVEGGKMLEDNIQAVRRTLQESRAVYREFESNCVDAGIMRSPEVLRKNMGQRIDNLANVQYLAKVLDLSSEDEEMELPSSIGDEYDRKELETSARETGMESLSAESVFQAPVYCDPVGRWNILLARNEKVEWAVMNDDGGLTPVKSIDPRQVKLLEPEGDGKKIFLDYMTTLNRRDSMLGFAYYLVDDYGYEDWVANTYYGAMAAAALDLLWRSSLIAHIRNGKLDRQGMIEGVIAYDMDRLDAPTIGAFI